MAKLKMTRLVKEFLDKVEETAISFKNKYIMPEHMVYVLLENEVFKDILESFDVDVKTFEIDLETFFENEEKVSVNLVRTDEIASAQVETVDYKQILQRAGDITVMNRYDTVVLQNIILAIFDIKESFFYYYLEEELEDIFDLVKAIAHTKFGDEDGVNKGGQSKAFVSINGQPMQPLDEIGEELKAMFSMMGLPMPPIPGLMDENPTPTETPKQKKNFKYLDKYATCLNDKEFKPVIGRQEEIELTCRTLARKDKSNPIHVGEPGVGKTAVVHGLVQAIKSGKVPSALKDKVVYEISMGSLIAGTKYRGEFEERLKGIISDVTSVDNIILYIDEIHQLIGSGATGSGSMDGAQILKPYLNDGSVKVIGSTTYKEYKKYIEADAALMRRFKKIDVAEPTVDECIQILEGLKETYETHHNVSYDENALKEAVNLSKKYQPERFLPDKAIDLIDEAGAYINQKKIKSRVVDTKLIQQILAETCNIPSANVSKDEKNALKNLSSDLKKNVFGQDEAIDAITDSVIIARAGLTNENKPMGSYLFVGPTGVGKTECAKTLAETLGLDFIRYDMSEYMEKHTASKLIGAPAGYVGYEEGGLLTEDIRKHPYCVLLLDEFEKAHEDIYNLFLQVMDNAQLTDNQGRVADFRNVIIIMTSNAGASKLGQRTLGFNSVSKDASVMTETVEKTFAPEFRNRLSGTIVFNSMSEEMATSIAKKQINILKKTLKSKGITLKVSSSVIKTIANKVTRPEFGGREVIRIVEKEIKPLFSKPIVFGELTEGSVCTLSYKNDNFTIKY